jgi:hypothetical protein
LAVEINGEPVDRVRINMGKLLIASYEVGGASGDSAPETITFSVDGLQSPPYEYLPLPFPGGG